MPYISTRSHSFSSKASQNRCVHRHGSSIKMAARTAAFEFSEEINGRESEARVAFFPVGQRLLAREILFGERRKKRMTKRTGWWLLRTDDKRCVYCMLQFGRKDEAGDAFLGGTTK